MIDIAISAPAFVVALPVIIVAAVLVAATSRGAPIFSQTRVGLGQRAFRCHKLRSMVAGTASVPTHEAAVASITPVGRWLRASKIDELPQLWNVLKGEMSLVGPRPCLPSQTELIECRERLGVFAIRPGITGYAQVRGVDMSDPPRLAELDAAYMRNASLGRDLSILWRTFVPAGRSG